MIDPARAAALRALDLLGPNDPCFEGDIALSSAREALNPLRKVWLEWDGEQNLPPEAWQILAAFEPLLFMTEEK